MTSSPESNTSESKYLYVKDELADIARDFPHARFEGNKSFDLKTRLGEKDTIIKDDERPPSGARDTEAVIGDWERAELLCTAQQFTKAERTMTSSIEDNLDTVAIAPLPVTRFLLLGFGAPHDELYGEKAVLQYCIARHFITFYFNEVANRYTDFNAFVAACQPEIICDSSRWYKQDLPYLKKKFEGALGSWKFLHAPLGNVLQVVDSRNVFVIMFQPDNPVRQMLADVVLASDSDSMPAAIICAKASEDVPSRHTGVFEPDETHDHVEVLLARYRGIECADMPDLAEGFKPWLYIDRELPNQAPMSIASSSTASSSNPSVHSQGNTPEAAAAPAHSPAPSHTGDTTESAHSGDSQVSSVYYRSELPAHDGKHLY